MYIYIYDFLNVYEDCDIYSDKKKNNFHFNFNRVDEQCKGHIMNLYEPVLWKCEIRFSVFLVKGFAGKCQVECPLKESDIFIVSPKAVISSLTVGV